MVTLISAIELATHNNTDLASKLIQIDQADARKNQARAAIFPKVLGTAVLSPIYSATGDALHTDVDLGKWGYWVQTTVTILEPLFTWGKISGFREAAEFGANVARAQARKDIQQIIYETKELYYGSILAEQLLNFLEDGKKDVTEVVSKVEEDQKRKRPTVEKRDYFRLKIFAAEADFRLEEARRLRTMAKYALSLKLGFDPNEETIPQETVINPIEAPPPSHDEVLKLMLDNRPEFAQLRNGIAAKKALKQAEHANLFPMIFAGGLLTFAKSDVRTAQQSAFAYDPYNRSTGGVGIGAQWSWDFFTTMANEAQIQAEIDELEKKEIYAHAGLQLELKNALAELMEGQNRVKTAREAYQIGKRWLVSETMGQSLGIGEVKNLVDAYLARAKTAKDLWEASYRVNLLWAALSRTVGTEVTPGLEVLRNR